MPYQPDDAGLTVALLESLRAAPDLMAAAAALGEPKPNEVERLRRQWPAELVRAALLLTRTRMKSTHKFAGLAEFWSPPEALEQASSLAVARHKARRFARGEIQHVIDLCCGSGGDTLGLLAEGLRVTAMDLSPARLWCVSANAQAAGLPAPETLCAALEPSLATLGAPAPGEAFHIDPARRSGARRTFRYEDMQPGPEVLDALLARFSAGAIKLSPAVDFASLPPGHLELISEDGTVVQAVLWTGGLAAAPSNRTATVLTAGTATSFTAVPASPAHFADAPHQWIYETDGAVHRAGLAMPLAAELGLAALSVDAGYLTAEALCRHAALACFEHVATLPYDARKLAAAVQTLQGAPGQVEVKTRGGLGIDVDTVQRQLAKHSTAACAVLIYRNGAGQVVASLCRRDGAGAA